MKIAVIGGSGFVGTHLIDILLKSQECEILNIDKSRSRKFPLITSIGNVLDLSMLVSSLKNMDVVILLAAEHRDDVAPASKYYDVNVKGMENTLEAMEANGIKRIIFTSSVAVYGLNKENPNEETIVQPFNHYGESKLRAEKILQKWYELHPHWNINIIRPTVIFGEGNRGNVYNLFNQISGGRFIMIGSGNNQKSMCYIGNIVAFIQYLILTKTNGYNLYNYVDKPDLSTNDLVYHIGKMLEKKIPPLYIPYWLGILGGYGFDVMAFILRRKLSISSVRIRKFCAVTQYDSTKAFATGFVPPFTLEQGIKRMLKSEF